MIKASLAALGDDIGLRYALAAVLLTLGAANPWGAAFFAVATLYGVAQRLGWLGRFDPRNVGTVNMLVAAAAGAMAENIWLGVTGPAALVPQHAVLAIAWASGVVGDLMLRGLQRTGTLHRPDPGRFGPIAEAVRTTARNPAFWYSITNFGFCLLGFLVAPSLPGQFFLLLSMAFAAQSVIISTGRMMAAARGIIPASAVNDGRSNLATGRSNLAVIGTSLVAAFATPALLLVAMASVLFAVTAQKIARDYCGSRLGLFSPHLLWRG